jgi:hypothetical protein
MTPLTNNAVDANAVEDTVLHLWQEFLGRYFDGETHDVGAVADVRFPLAELHFQQSAVSQPLDKSPAPGLAITMVWSEGDRRRWTAWEGVSTPANDQTPDNPTGTRQEICYERVAWNLWVRATGTNGRMLGKSGSDRLFGLISNRGETHALGQKGICRLKASAPRVIQETNYVLRVVTCAGTLRYPILSQV